MKTPPRPPFALRGPRRHERGVILIAALAVLLMLTLLSVSMFRSFGLEEKITGNTREKQHAFYAAQTALQYAESQLNSGAVTGTGVVCDSATQPSTAMTICNTATAETQSWLVTEWASNPTSWGYQYTPPEIATTSSANVEGVYAAPIFTVAYLGPAPSGLGQGVLYQVTALGYGANPNATAVVQSVYYVGSPSQCVSDCN